jgi:hypothetical protein
MKTGSVSIAGLARYLLPLLLLAACVQEDKSTCADSLDVTFSFTRDGVELLGSAVTSLSVFVFDENEILVGRWDEYDSEKLAASDFTMTLPLEPGLYSIVAWGGLQDNHYAVSAALPGNQPSPLVAGETTLSRAVVSLTGAFQGAGRSAIDYRPVDQFHGSVMNVQLERVGTTRVNVDLVKNSKQVTLSLVGLPPSTRAGRFEARVEADNGASDFFNNLVTPGDTMAYLPFNQETVNDTTRLDFYTLRLVTGRECQLILVDMQEGWTILDSDLLEGYIRKVPRYASQAGIDAEDHFDILVDASVPLAVKVTVNGWDLSTSGSDIQ